LVTKILMPRLSLAMKKGTVIEWFKKEGDTVEKGEPLVEVLTEKVTYDIEAPSSGVLRKILVEVGAEVPVAGILAVIAAPDEELPVLEVAAEPSLERVEERIIASPAAKRLAKEYGVDLIQVKGTGPEGRIVEEDLRRYVEAKEVAPKIREVIPLTGIRKTAAERVSLSARTAPHTTLNMEVDMSKAAKLREEIAVSYTDMVTKATAKALVEHPIINSTLDGAQIKVFHDINLGVAVATEKGLIVPVIQNTDSKTLEEIASKLKELADKARQGKLTKDELTGGTFTITNLGMYGVDTFTPIINPPETAILGVGRLTEKPVVENKKIVIKPIMNLSLSFDHRVVDGAPAAQFLRKIRKFLENPEILLAARA